MALLHNDTQYNGTQHDDTQHNDTQRNDTQHNNTHRSNKNVTLRITTLNAEFWHAKPSVASCKNMLSVIMPSAVVPNVVAPVATVDNLDRFHRQFAEKFSASSIPTKP
jgi:hypothetical protein